MITKKQALEEFIRDRVLGTMPMAYEASLGRCLYGHTAPGGGCEIGRRLPGPVAARMDELGYTEENMGSYNSFVGCAEKVEGKTIGLWLEETFEEHGDEFWLFLQRAHDARGTDAFQREMSTLATWGLA